MALTWGQVAYIIVCVTTTTTNFEPDQVFFVLINYLCISYVLFVDIFTRSFDDFILMKFPIAVFFPASPFITFGDFCQLPRYCTLHVYYFGQTLPASPFILPSPSIWNLIVVLEPIIPYCAIWGYFASYEKILRLIISYCAIL